MMPESTGELNFLAHQKYGRMYGALTKEEQRSLIPSEPGYDRLLTSEEEAIMSDQEPKPQKINRLDPAWAQFAAAYLTQPWDPGMGWSPGASPQMCADFADAMLRERDRRDREEQ